MVPCFFIVCLKLDNFCNFLFGLQEKDPFKTGSYLEETISSRGASFSFEDLISFEKGG